MKSSKLRLTHLRKKIFDVLPDTDDIKGYQGISKRIIIESINESYALLSVFDEYNDKFETIFAKREIAQLIERANEYLNVGWFSEDNDRFNDFLHLIAQIRFILRNTYDSFVKEPLKIDKEIVETKEKLNTLNQNISDISSIKSELNTTKDECSILLNKLKEVGESLVANDKKSKELMSSLESINEQMKGSSEKINVWKEEISILKSEIVNKQAEFAKLRSDSQVLYETSIKQKEQLEGNLKEFDKQKAMLNDHQLYIQNTIDDVSRAGLAGSFKKRKDELKWIQLLWGALTILSISVLLLISFKIVAPMIEMNSFKADHLFVRIPVFASAIWLGWFCAKQYGFTSRIMEDYSYKYAVSMAFEGYKNETLDMDTGLLQKLLELTIFNISKSPVVNYDTKSNHGTPYNELLEKLLKRSPGNEN